MIWVSFSVQLAKTPNYPAMCRFPLFIALCDHNPPVLQTDRQSSQTYEMLVAKLKPFYGLLYFSGTACVSRYQKGKTRKVKPIWIDWSKRQWVAVASTRPYANLRQITTPAPHHSVFYRPDALPAAQPTKHLAWTCVLFLFFDMQCTCTSSRERRVCKSCLAYWWHWQWHWADCGQRAVEFYGTSADQHDDLWSHLVSRLNDLHYRRLLVYVWSCC